MNDHPKTNRRRPHQRGKIPRPCHPRRTVVLNGESVERFDALYHSRLAEHQPVTQSEAALVNAMAVALWRQLRVWGFEKLSVDTDTDNQDYPPWYSALRSYVRPGADADKLLRYETAYGRQLSRAQKELAALKSRRSGAPPVSPAGSISASTWDSTVTPDLNAESGSRQ